MTILALHGAGRDETDLQKFCKSIAPDSRLIAPRGEFRVGFGYSFFQRRPSNSIDGAELVALAGRWIIRFDRNDRPSDQRMVLVGYSSGAIFAEALLAARPERFAAVVLLRPEPLAQEFVFPGLAGKPVIILAGRRDERREPDAAARLAAQLRSASAAVALHLLETGHGWAPDEEDVSLARSWLALMPAC